MGDQCYYTVLNIEKTATDEQIKKAYRKLAIRYHPDKNLDNKEEAEKKFKEIGEAYSVLSDETKRQQYDRFGKAAVNGSGGGGGPGNMNGFHGQDAEEIFRSFFGGQDPFSMFFQEGMQGGGGRGGPFGSRVHVSHFGPGFTFTSFGGHPHMRARHFQNRQQQQQQQQQRHHEAQETGLRLGGGNVLLIMFLLWCMGVPLSYLWLCLMLLNYLGLI